MRHTAFLSIAAVSALLVATPQGVAEDRPRYGGTLRVQLREAVHSPDPGEGRDLTGARQRIAFLVFDRLTRIDEEGRVRPELAISWNADAQRKTWRFTLRSGVTFHDGSPLTAAHVVSAFANDARWQVRNGSGPNVIVFECTSPIADLPAIVAGARHSIVLRNAEGPQGTGRFRIVGWQAGRQLSLAANPDHFEGRPYLDGIEMLMGNSLREQLIDLRLDRDDLVEVDLEQARRLTAASQRVESSAPSRLLAMVFRQDAFRDSAFRTAGASAGLRELLARTIDRETMHAAIVRRPGTSAPSLLPQWLTGYAVLFSGKPDIARIQKLRSDAMKAPPIYLAYDASDAMNKAVAERMAVNARDVGIHLQVLGEKNVGVSAAGSTSRADAVLVTLPLGSAHAGQALVQFAEAAATEPSDGELLAANTPEQLFAAEKSFLERYRVIPIAHLPASVWTSTRVRNWKISPDGRWKLEQVWLDSVK